MSISVVKRTVLCSLCLLNDLFVALDYRHLPCWQNFELVPLFVYCGFDIRGFSLRGIQEEA